MILSNAYPLFALHLLSTGAGFVHSFSMPSMSSTASMTMGTSAFGSESEDGVQECIKRAEEKHEAEFEYGACVFGQSSPLDDETKDVSSWCNDDFTDYSVGTGNGGPSEKNLSNGHLIFETKEAVLDGNDCDFFIQTARETIKNGRIADMEKEINSDDPAWERTNSELGEARISNLPPASLERLNSILQKSLYPMLQERFGVEDLSVYDGLILGSIAPSMSQPVHRDASLVTLNIALSSPDDFEGGGTYIEGLENHNGLPLCIDRGKVLCHSSGIMHAGTAISAGERWVLVLFVIAKNEVQVARRAHAEGLYRLDSKNLSEAVTAFDTGLKYAPNDHVLHMGKGQIASIRGNEQESMDCLAKAATYYPASHKAAMTFGKMMEAKRKPRAALRRFDSVLSLIEDKDLLNGAWMPLKALAWDARVSAGRCALLCAEYEASRFNWSVRERSWTKTHLPQAIKRFETALIAVPNDGYIASMLQRANELLSDANDFPVN